MSRQYVHLSTNVDMAKQVASRKTKTPIILVVNAKLAYDSGIKFYSGNEIVWLADVVPCEFIERCG